MNLLRGTAREGRVAAGELVLNRPGIPDGEVVVGLRPEAMRPAADSMPSLDFRVTVVEPLGDELIVHGALAADLIAAGADMGEQLSAANGGGLEAVPRLDPRQRPAEGSTIRLGVDASEVHVFDAKTGFAIR
jgi:ABC-type sugar transport system ATPase subunit